MTKQELRYRGSRRILAFVVMLAISVGLVPLAAVWYNAARAQALTPAEGVTVPLSVVRVLELTEQEKEEYRVESAAQAEDAEGRVTGYLIITSARGYKSDIRVLSQDETEYLGNRVESVDFTSLFAGRVAPMKLWGTATLGSPIDAISGSTVSSQAVVDAVNLAYAFLKTKI